MTQRIKTPYGDIEFELTRKKVRNLNLRVCANASVALSAPLHMPKNEIESFMLSKANWILKHQNAAKQKKPLAPCLLTKDECLNIFTPISNYVFPLFASVLSGQKPLIKVREMKTRWGVCNITKKTITLSTNLAQQPLPAVEYVILHEYVHFIHPNHQAGFHAEMLRLMPDYKARRNLLKKG